jgi:hypothetical protein
VAAALARCAWAAVILTEETDWIGGQLTAQAVPPDENPWIESVGGSNSYQRLREGIRAYYRQHYPLTEEAREIVHLNPGNGNVSALCHEPRVALAVLEAMLAALPRRAQLLVLLQPPPGARRDGGRPCARDLCKTTERRERCCIRAVCLDATELGDLLELAGVEHVIGSESQAQTGEPHALPGEPDPLDQQAVTWCFAMDYLPGEDFTIDPPRQLRHWRALKLDFWPGPQLGWEDVTPKRWRRATAPSSTRAFGRLAATMGTFWQYRRIFNARPITRPGCTPAISPWSTGRRSTTGGPAAGRQDEKRAATWPAPKS